MFLQSEMLQDETASGMRKHFTARLQSRDYGGREVKNLYTAQIGNRGK